MGLESVAGGATKASNLSSVGGAVVGTVAGALISSSFAKADAKRQRELQAELEKLSLAQQKELETRAQNISGEIAKQALILEYLGRKDEADALNALKSKRYTMYIVIGVGLIALSFVALKLSQKK
jgi:hypothetical protein